MSYLDGLSDWNLKIETQALQLPMVLGTKFSVEGVEYQIIKREEYYDEELSIYSWRYQIKKLPDTKGGRWVTTNYRIRKSLHEKKGKIL